MTSKRQLSLTSIHDYRFRTLNAMIRDETHDFSANRQFTLTLLLQYQKEADRAGERDIVSGYEELMRVIG
jgi:hypothetical protein